MRCLIGIDDTDSSRGYCTTYLGYRIAVDLRPKVEVLPYPRLVRLNPNVPFKTRGNAAVSLTIETKDPDAAFESISAKVAEFSDVDGGANSGMVFLVDPSMARTFEPLYDDCLSGVVSPHRVRRFLRDNGVRSFELGNGMGIVGAAASIGFSEQSDHTSELISYRRKQSWGTKRELDTSSVREMDKATFPRTFNNYDYQKKKVLIAPHGPDPVFLGVRGDSPATVIEAFEMLSHDEEVQGHIVYVSNQHTDAHLQKELEWKAYSSGWFEGDVQEVQVREGGHTYMTIRSKSRDVSVAAYEPTGDLRRAVRLLCRGDRVRVFGGVRKGTSLHPMVLNMEKMEVISLKGKSSLEEGTYISSPRSNRHLTKPLIRYGRENFTMENAVDGWFDPAPMRPRVRA
jgi:tRNA(Ile2)-agmatinylcytidine synthase